MRHPIYLGWSVTAFGTSLLSSSLLGLVVAATITIFYDVRARHEERLLVQRYPSYAQHALSSSRFIPGVY